jgi:hypothetical protein
MGKQLYQIGLFHDIEANKRAFRELQGNGHIHYDRLPFKNRRGETAPVEIVSKVYYEDQRPLWSQEAGLMVFAPRPATRA